MKPFQIQLLKKYHLHNSFSKAISQKEIVCLFQIQNLSIEDKQFLQKELLPFQFQLVKVEDKINPFYGSIGMNSNNIFMISNIKKLDKEVQMYIHLLKCIQLLRKLYPTVIFLGLKYFNEFSTVEIFSFLKTDLPLDEHYNFLNFQAVNNLSIPVNTLLSQLSTFTDIFQILERNQ